MHYKKQNLYSFFTKRIINIECLSSKYVIIPVTKLYKLFSNNQKDIQINDLKTLKSYLKLSPINIPLYKNGDIKHPLIIKTRATKKKLFCFVNIKYINKIKMININMYVYN